ncbi:ATP-dependent nuclease [Corynebacterium ulcerans]|uniref:ATP-dependent nuclease n=1 Tax=Corynebacterium ulcerans TaxID=65058 RepID=UPI000C770B47|nr:AAA family ATPase [Corynebacterium ulcerans]PLW01595.1 hypothetical protein BRL54_10145 [Corynebacterium ulcerans]
MHITKLSLVNYRNFRKANLKFQKGVNTVIGENGSGKSNLLRAIRLLLDDTLVGRRHDLREDDFWRGLDDWRGHWIVIKLEFQDVSMDEEVQSLLLHNTAEESLRDTEKATYSLVFRPNLEIRKRLATVPPGDKSALEAIRSTINLSDYERCLFGKMKADLTCPEEYSRIVGDFEKVNFPTVENNGEPPSGYDLGIKIPRDLSLSREFSLSYIPALRDVVSDFGDYRKNPLRTLLNAKSEEVSKEDLSDIIDKVDDLNESIQNRDDVKQLTTGIRKRFKDTVGETFSPTSMKIQSELPIEASDLFRSLKLYVGENGEREPRRLYEMSLGGANLVYLTLKLLEFEYKTSRQPIANFLLIEEPEAHIHTHVQKTLFDRVKFENTQIIYTTHSPQISEVSEVQRVNVLGREGEEWIAMQPSAGLEKQQIIGINRFLDAIRSNLLFARSVLLVEGDAEEILIPTLMKKIYGISLDEIGLTLVNVRSTGFETLINLFGKERIKKHCSVLTDYDQPFFDTDLVDGEKTEVKNRKLKAQRSAESGVERKKSLDALVANNIFVSPYYAPHTFEVDFANESESNRNFLVELTSDVYKQDCKINEVKDNLNSGDISDFGSAALRLATHKGKGWFALLMASHIEDGGLKKKEVNGSSDEDTVSTDDEKPRSNWIQVEVPSYILESIAGAVKSLPLETWQGILEERNKAFIKAAPKPKDSVDKIPSLPNLVRDDVELEKALEELEETHPDQPFKELVRAFLK